MSSIEERVKKIVVEQLGVKEDEVTANASFVDDLGADSLDTVELVMALEEEFECEIPDEDAEKITSVQMAIVMLGPDLRIRRFTPAAERMLNLIGTDIGRPIGDIRMRVEVPDFEHLLHDVIDSMSPREVEVLELIRRGLRNREIAARCGISEETVQTHVKSILLKLDAQDRTAAVNIALSRGIIHMV